MALYNSRPVLIKFSTEASLELCVGGEAYVNGSPWKQRLLIKDAAGRCPSNLNTVAKRVIRNSNIARMLPKRKHFFHGSDSVAMSAFYLFSFFFHSDLRLIKILGTMNTNTGLFRCVLKEMKIST